MQLSIRSLLLLCVYGGVCSLTYVYSNLWVGTAVVAATIALLSYATVHAFQSRRHFPLGFSLAAFAWMSFWLGFYAETSTNYKPWSVPRDVYVLMTGDREFPKINTNANPSTYAVMHSLHFSLSMARYGDPQKAPSMHNAIRLAVCVTAIGFGLAVGLIAQFVIHLRGKPRAQSYGAQSYGDQSTQSERPGY
jgi:hypothetical protein